MAPDLLQRVFVAMVLNKDVPADTELRMNVPTYFNRAAESAKVMLPNLTFGLWRQLRWRGRKRRRRVSYQLGVRRNE